MMNTTSEIITALRDITTRAKQEFGNLNALEVNFKPGEGKWSIGQCFDHLIVTNTTYYPQFDEIVRGEHRNTFYQNRKIIARYIGKRMIADLGADVKKPFVSPQIFAPAQSTISFTIIPEFVKHQEELIARIEKMKDTDLNETVIYSPINKAIIYTLRDALNIIVGHEERHFRQAMRVKPVLPSSFNRG